MVESTVFFLVVGIMLKIALVVCIIANQLNKSEKRRKNEREQRNNCTW